MTDLQITDWTSLLLSLNVNIPVDKSEFNTFCPFHSDTQPSCSINTEKGVWICFAGCGQGSLHYFVKKLLHIDDDVLEDMIIKFDLFDSLDETFTLESEITQNPIEMPTNTIFGHYPQWILNRGFSVEQLRKWNCVISYAGDLVIPAHTKNNVLVGTITRRLNKDPKYMYSKGFQKSKLLFGENHLEESNFVCVVEGSLDAIWLSQLGYPTVALLGMSLSSTQEQLLSNLNTKELVLCLDNDKAGQIGLQQALIKLEKHMPTTYIEMPTIYKDVQDIREKSVVDKLISTRVYF